jgi:hypothetical protein
LPETASKQESLPAMPSVQTVPSTITGVDFGPLPCLSAAGFMV